VNRFVFPNFVSRVLAIASLAAAIAAPSATTQKTSEPGASDTEIKIGNIAPYTGWGNQYAAVARAEAAYFQMVNDRGGINGRKITFIILDNASDVAKSPDLARKLVEPEQVLLIFSSIGTEGNLAIRGYLNDRKVPQLFAESSSAVFNDPSHFPWTMGFFATFRSEAVAYAQYILQNKPAAKVGILYANDDAGEEFLVGARDGFGDKASALIVKEVSYQVSDQSLQAQITALEAAGADVFLNFSVGQFTTQAIRSAYDVDWHPLQFIPNASLSAAAFLEPAGPQISEGIISNARSRSWLSPRAHRNSAVREYLDWMSKYNPGGSLRDQDSVAGYERAQALVAVLKNCGDNLTRANVMKQAASLDLELGMLRSGINIKTTPTD
jgi:branched-chain amino acid transport system substrate-binding protein